MLVNCRRPGPQRRLRVEHALGGVVVDEYGLGGLLSSMGAVGNHDRHRFAGVAHPARCQDGSLDDRQA